MRSPTGDQRLDLANCDGIFGKGCVGSNECDALNLGLSDEHAIKGVLVQRRKAVERHGMSARQCKLVVAIIQQPTPKEARVDFKVATPDALFDGNLPKAHGA